MLPPEKLETIEGCFCYQQQQAAIAWIEFKIEFIKSLPMPKSFKKKMRGRLEKQKQEAEEELEDFINSFDTDN